MGFSELLFGSLLVLALLSLAGYFSWQQKHNLNLLGADPALSPEDRQYLLSQVRRRLCCSVLMVVLAGQLLGWFFLENHLRDLQAAPAAGGAEQAHKEEARDLVRLLVIYWIAALFVLLGVLTLAALDFLATARMGLSKQRQLAEARRAMLDSQAARFRRERNGHH